MCLLFMHAFPLTPHLAHILNLYKGLAKCMVSNIYLFIYLHFSTQVDRDELNAYGIKYLKIDCRVQRQLLGDAEK